MAPMQVKLRKAIGAFKDQTSISIAKVAGTTAPDLDVALVKATSHDEVPIEEKYVQEIIYLTSCSRAYVSSCVSGLARRLSKTHNWIVAIKTLMLAHRLFREGDPAFAQELRSSGRRGMRLLTASDFRDESHSNGWDYSAFVRTYGLFLDERLDCCFGSLASRPKAEITPAYGGSRYEYSDSEYHSQDGYGSRYDYEDQTRREEKTSKVKLVKDMQPQELMEDFPVLQRVLERLLACRPTGLAKMNRLVHIALYPVLRESFQLYADMRDGLAILLDAFFDMDQRDCGRVFDIYSRIAKQINELISFYSFCKSIGVCRASEYPVVDKIADDLLQTMEDFLRNRTDSSRGSRGPKSSEPREFDERDEETSYEVNGMKALPAPPLPPIEEAPVPVAKIADVPKHTESTNVGGEGYLLNLEEPAMSAEAHENKLALALFSGTETRVNTKWETFSSTAGDQGLATSGAATSSNGAAASGWELALIETESDLSKPNGNTLAGGFDNLLLNSLYEQGAINQKVAAGMAPAGSASSVAMPGQAQTKFLALPAPPGLETVLEADPFAASVPVPPPAYVQMSDMRQKQQLAVQEQQLWMHYQQQGMQGYNTPMKLPINPYAASFQSSAYPVAYYAPNPYFR